MKRGMERSRRLTESWVCFGSVEGIVVATWQGARKNKNKNRYNTKTMTITKTKTKENPFLPLFSSFTPIKEN